MKKRISVEARRFDQILLLTYYFERFCYKITSIISYRSDKSEYFPLFDKMLSEPVLKCDFMKIVFKA